MKILVLSDSHGNARGVENAVKKYGRNADLIVHCGDATRGEAEDLARKSDIPVVCVRGNCDFVTDLNDIEYLDLCGRRIMITHGHLFGVKYGLERLSYSAEEKGRVTRFLWSHPYRCRRNPRRRAYDKPRKLRKVAGNLRGCGA